MVEQADTRDLKSLALKSVPVRSRSPAPENPGRAMPFRDFLCQENRDRTHSSGTCQRQVPSPSAHTGGSLYFCQWQTCISIPVTKNYLFFPPRFIALMAAYPSIATTYGKSLVKG